MGALRGVNLGGWLILERWMTPSVFDATDAQDEFTFMASPGAEKRLQEHRRTFITEADFVWIADHDIDAVRIPVGFWVLEDTAPYINAREMLDWAFDMAAKHGLKVLLDLHGLPGSQNGHDHSGKSGSVTWQGSRANRDRSLYVLRGLADRYGKHPALWGLQVINEPNAGALQVFLRTYYRRAYRLLKSSLPAAVKIIYSDAWSPRLLSRSLPFADRAVMDVHLYHMTTLGASKRSLEWFFKTFTRRSHMFARVNRRRPIIIGEWSGIVSHETFVKYPWLDERAVFTYYVRLQKETYDGYLAWFYWSYKTEDAGLWNYRAMVEAGLL